MILEKGPFIEIPFKVGDINVYNIYQNFYDKYTGSCLKCENSNCVKIE